MDLPKFTYHPDPIATGSIRLSDAPCLCCGRSNGYIYSGPIYAIDELEEAICPWCIADGSAHSKFDAEFTDASGVGGYGDWDRIPQAVIQEITTRTPGFSGWQQEKWWTHCGDGAEFLGPVGSDEAKALGPGFLAFIRAEAGLDSDLEWVDYLQALNRDHGPTAYAFRCRHCATLGGYSDVH